VPPTTAGKIATGIAGVTGTSSLGITAAALTRIASAQAVPTGIWIVLAWLSTATVAVAGLGLVLDYERAKLEITARAQGCPAGVLLHQGDVHHHAAGRSEMMQRPASCGARRGEDAPDSGEAAWSPGRWCGRRCGAWRGAPRASRLA
jgi:hypothetical protein